MPGTFFAGEAAALGLDTGFTGLYLGGNAFVSLIFPAVVAWLTQHMGLPTVEPNARRLAIGRDRSLARSGEAAADRRVVRSVALGPRPG